LDAALLAGNVATSADALGLGSVFLGEAAFKADLIRDVCDVPERVFPVVALGL
jgi:hypothetical protein